MAKQPYQPQGKGLDEPGANRQVADNGGLVTGKKAASWLTNYQKNPPSDTSATSSGNPKQKQPKQPKQPSLAEQILGTVGGFAKGAVDSTLSMGNTIIKGTSEALSSNSPEQRAAQKAQDQSSKISTDLIKHAGTTIKDPNSTPQAKQLARQLVTKISSSDNKQYKQQIDRQNQIIDATDPIKNVAALGELGASLFTGGTAGSAIKLGEGVVKGGLSLAAKNAVAKNIVGHVATGAAQGGSVGGLDVLRQKGSRATGKDVATGAGEGALGGGIMTGAGTILGKVLGRALHKTAEEKPLMPNITDEHFNAMTPQRIGVTDKSTPSKVLINTPDRQNPLKMSKDSSVAISAKPTDPLISAPIKDNFKSMLGKPAILKNDAGKAIRVIVSKDGASFKLDENLVHDGQVIAKKGATEINGVPNSLGSLGPDFVSKGKLEAVAPPPPESIDRNVAFGETDHNISSHEVAPLPENTPSTGAEIPAGSDINPTAQEYGHSVQHPDQIVKDTVDAAHQYDKEVKGGQILDTAHPDDPYGATGGIKRISEHSDFYRQFFKENGHAPSKAAYEAEVRAQIAKGEGSLVHKDIADAHGIATANQENSIVREPTLAEISQMGDGREASALQTAVEKAHNAGDTAKTSELISQMPHGMQAPTRRALGLPDEGGNLTPLQSVSANPETRVSKLASSVKNDALQKKLISKTEAEVADLSTHNVANMKEQAHFATGLVETSPQHAIDIALGKTPPPAHILPQMVFNAVEEHAQRLGGKEGGQLLKDLASSKHVSNLSVMAQNVRAAAERDPHSAVTAINDVALARSQAAESRTKVSIANSQQADRKIISAATPTVSKYDWESFVNSIKC